MPFQPAVCSFDETSTAWKTREKRERRKERKNGGNVWFVTTCWYICLCIISRDKWKRGGSLIFSSYDPASPPSPTALKTRWFDALNKRINLFTVAQVYRGSEKFINRDRFLLAFHPGLRLPVQWFLQRNSRTGTPNGKQPWYENNRQKSREGATNDIADLWIREVFIFKAMTFPLRRCFSSDSPSKMSRKCPDVRAKQRRTQKQRRRTTLKRADDNGERSPLCNASCMRSVDSRFGVATMAYLPSNSCDSRFNRG